jgi:hypothetical protein
VQRSAFCRSRRELSNAYFLAKFGFDIEENEACKVCPLSAYRSPRFPIFLFHHLRLCTNVQDASPNCAYNVMVIFVILKLFMLFVISIARFLIELSFDVSSR